MRSEPHQFPNSQGHHLAARLDLPGVGKPRAYLLFAHCFTCGKDLKAVRSISEALTDLGIAVFRFDFPGLGQSEGEFSDSTFSSNVDDLYRAAVYLGEIAEAPQILIGHSLGGAAVLRAAAIIDSVRAVATIGAPSDPVHVTHLLSGKLDEIREQGEATVSLARREFLIKQDFIDDLEKVSTEDATGKLRKALLILHSPVDEIVGIDNAARIYDRAKHPKSFVSLDDADHLLTRDTDSKYAARTIAAWAERYLTPETDDAEQGDTVVRLHGKGFRTDVWTGGHRLTADEPVSVGGTDAGPAPYDFLLSSLGTCTAMTLRMYADHKKWSLHSIEVRLRHDKKEEIDGEGKKVKKDLIEREILVEGNLDEEQRARLLEIGDKCPVHRTLESSVEVRSRLVS